MTGRRGFTLVEILIATLVLATLGLTIFDLATGSTRGVSTDRLTEAERGLVQDMLEQFCQPYTSIPVLFPKPRGNGPPFSRKFTLDEVMNLVQIPEPERPTLKGILTRGGVDGFTVTWWPRIDNGHGTTDDALRLDYLQVVPVVAGDSPGPRVESFRVFLARGAVGE